MELGSKIAQLYKTISQNPFYAGSYIGFAVHYPLYLLERVANYLVRNNLVENYFEQSDFDKLQLNSEMLLEIGNSIDSDIEQLSSIELRKFCKEFIDLLLANRSQWSSGWTKGGSDSFYNSLRPDYNLYNFIVSVVKPSPNQIIYQPDCNLGSMFIRFSHEFSDHNLKFIGQEYPFNDDSFLCKFNLFANGLEKVSSIYSEDPLNISTNQTKVKADIAIATNYPHGPLYPRDEYIDISQLESNEKICSYEIAYIELMLSLTKDNGKVIAVVPDSFLVNNQSKNFRKKYLENDLVEKIISLPKNVFTIYNSPSASIIILNKHKSAKNKDFIIFDGKDERLEETQIDKNSVFSDNRFDLRVARYASKEAKELKNILNNATYPIKRLKDAIQLSILGANYSPKNRVNENSTENLPYVRITDLAKNGTQFDLDISKVERKISREKAHKIIDFSAVLVSKIAPKIKPTYFNFTGQPIVIGSDVIALKTKENVNIEYFITQLHSPLVQIQVEIMSSGTTINRISTEDFLDFQILLPSLEEQQREISAIRGLISEKAIAEEKVIDAQYEVVANINHSLKNKLAVIINDYDTLVRFLRRKERNNETINFANPISANAVGDDIDTIEIVTERLKTNLLDASKVFKNAEKIQKQTLNKEVVELVRFFTGEVKPLYLGKNYSIEVIAKPNLELNVWLDKDAFKDVIENLIENAKCHGFINNERNYRIMFELSELEDADNVDEETSTKFARIIYKNDGKPFPRNFSFEDYKQFSNKAGKTQGTGIGGYVINKMIELHDGRFNFISPSDDFTVEFEILLPLEN